MIHVCFTVYDKTGSAAKFAGTSMVSMFENLYKARRSSVTVHIVHDKTLTDDNRSKFSYLAGSYGQLIKFYDVEELCANKLAVMERFFPNIDMQRFNLATFYKLLIPQVLPLDLGKVIYLESNTIVNMDINDLWRIELGNTALGAVPARVIDSDILKQDRVVADGLIKPEDYFSAGVLLMNLDNLRGAENKILAGLRFVAEKNYLNLLDQTVLNCCFAVQAVKLPVAFNEFVRSARRKGEAVANKIYLYTIHALQINLKDPFNALWMEYFAKTTWFDVAAIGRLFDSFRDINNKAKKTAVNLSVIMSGKTRAFCVTPDQLEEAKKAFHIRGDEEIIPLTNQASLRALANSMKRSQGRKVFFILARNFPFNALVNAGFVHGRDFVNGFEFLSEDEGVSLNSYPLIHAM